MQRGWSMSRVIYGWRQLKAKFLHWKQRQRKNAIHTLLIRPHHCTGWSGNGTQHNFKIQGEVTELTRQNSHRTYPYRTRPTNATWRPCFINYPAPPRAGVIHIRTHVNEIETGKTASLFVRQTPMGQGLFHESLYLQWRNAGIWWIAAVDAGWNGSHSQHEKEIPSEKRKNLSDYKSSQQWFTMVVVVSHNRMKYVPQKYSHYFPTDSLITVGNMWLSCMHSGSTYSKSRS